MDVFYKCELDSGLQFEYLIEVKNGHTIFSQNTFSENHLQASKQAVLGEERERGGLQLWSFPSRPLNVCHASDLVMPCLTMTPTQALQKPTVTSSSPQCKSVVSGSIKIIAFTGRCAVLSILMWKRPRSFL